MTRLFSGGVVLMCASLLSLSAAAQLAETLNYVELTPRQPTTDPDRIVITEYFSYQCPHCYAFDPTLHDWVSKLPEDVLFERVSVSIGRQPWAPIARAFYTLQAMEKLGELDRAIFRAIHVDGKRLYDKEAIVDWVEGQGLDGEEFSETYDSFSVKAFVQRAEQRSRNHRIPSIPALDIDGRYVVPIADNGTVELFDQQLVGIGELIDSVRAQRGL